MGSWRRIIYAAAAALAGIAIVHARQPIVPPPAESFVWHDTGRIAVSPSGHYIAVVTTGEDGRSTLSVAPFRNGELGRAQIFSASKTPIVDIAFKSDDLLLLTVFQENVRLTGITFEEPGAQTIDRTVVVAMPRQGGSPRSLMPRLAQSATVKTMLHDDGEHIVLQAFEGRVTESKVYRVATLYRVNVNTGASEILEGPLGREIGTTRDRRFVATTGWEVDNAGNAYLRYDLEPDRGVVTVMARGGDGVWQRLARYPLIANAPRIDVVGRASASTLYAIDRANEDRRAVWEFDLATRRPLRPVVTDANGETAYAYYDPYRGKLLGAEFMVDGKPKQVFLSRALRAAQAALDDSFPDYAINRIIDYSRDYGVYTVLSEGPARPPVNVLFDARTMNALVLGPVYPLDPAKLAPVRTISYPSSDGRRIVAFLTVPRGADRSTPIIVMPHGGPESSDSLGFEGTRQFLASRGYIVLQPQFRGSDGFGAAFEAAGHRHWATLVQDDIRAGLDHLASESIGDHDRICIFGWSYGGYLALAGAALNPGLYRCAIAGAPIADLEAWLAALEQEFGEDGEPYQYWLARIGEGASVAAASPVKLAGQIDIPVLLIHGEADRTVPIRQSEVMEAALKEAGGTVTFMRMAREGHTLGPTAEAEMLRRIEAFLSGVLAR